MQRDCQQCALAFEITEDDLAFYKDRDVPPPILCPLCRSQLRCLHRNERGLHRRMCDLCARQIISMYDVSVPFPVYCQECFFSDRWNPLDTGKPYDATQPFFAQYHTLLQRTPHLSIINKQTENSAYSNYSYANKNCYLTFGSHQEEDCLYGAYSTRNANCLDCVWLYGSELVYESLFSGNCYHSAFLAHCNDCADCLFSRDLQGCRNCLFCANLHQKQFCIFNEQHTEESYRAALESYDLETHAGWEEARRIFLEEMPQRFPIRALHQTHCEQCNGDVLTNCKKMQQCFLCADSEECAYGAQIDNTFRGVDCDFMGYDRSERLYQTIGCQGLYDCIACNACWHGDGLRYCQLCFSCRDCFGCVSLQQKQYCIFNSQYSKEEYEALVPTIVERMRADGTWGTFFPPAFSPFPVNDTVAQDWLLLTREQAAERGLTWRTHTEKLDVDKVIPAAQLPDSIDDIPDDIVNWAIECEATKRPFKIIRQELEFYRQMRLPVPRLHPDERHRRRMALRNPRKLWKRECQKCGKEIETTYAPERPEIVYCENCFLQTVY